MQQQGIHGMRALVWASVMVGATMWVSSVRGQGAPLPNAPAVAPTVAPVQRLPEWQQLVASSSSDQGHRITVVRSGHNVYCQLDAVTPEGLFCHESLPLLLLFPRAPHRLSYMVPPDDVVKVRSPRRLASSLVTFGVGFGLGAGAAAASGSGATTGVVAWSGAVSGLLTAGIGYEFPFIHRTLYRKPHRP